MYSPDKQQELLDNMVEEFTERLRQGEHPGIQEFVQRYPGISSEVEDLLTSVAMIEELKTQSNSTADSLKREMKEILRLDRIGDYRIIRELGRGGMGIVFEAIHESLGRRVAIKVMLNRTFDDQKYLERFKREAQAAANLHHTNIVSVFGIGQTGDHHYYVMEFVDGESLSDIISRLNGLNESKTQDGMNTETIPAEGRNKSERFGTTDCSKRRDPRSKPGFHGLFDSPKQRYRWAADLGVQISDGLAYAHGLGTLHRDIKPSNLMVDTHETVWLTDFGLVKNTSNQSITKTGDIIGTPQYMAPESFEGTYEERSETYCLGLTLYEMVTLKPAYENASTPELIRRITTTSPLAPRKIDRQIPWDLSRIIQKAISREPGYRYQRAADMRDDLRAFLDDRPISARKISMTENIWRWSKRNPLPASLAIATGLVICLAAITATIALNITNRALAESEQKKTSLEVEKRVASYARRKAEETIDFTVDSFDEMFRRLILKGQNGDSDISLDGFNDLAGISTTVNESDAEFLDQMLQFYLDFAEKNKNNIALKTLTAQSFRRVANIHHLTGELENAVDAYERSIKIYEEVQSSSSGEIPIVLDLANTINERGRAFELQGFPTSREKAVAEFSRAIQLLRKYSSHDEPQIQTGLARTLILVGSPPESYRPPLPERFEEVRKWSPSRWYAPQSTGSTALAPIYKISKPAKSKLAIDEAVQISDQLLQENPDANEPKFIKAIALTRRASLERSMRSWRAAGKSLKMAQEILIQLREDNPDNPEYKFALAQNYAVPLRFNKKNEIRSLNNSKEILIGLASKFDRNLDYKRSLANVCFRLGLLQLSLDQGGAAARSLKMANSTFQLLIPETPRSRSIQSNGLACLLQYVDLLMDDGKTDLAVDNIEQALENLERNRRGSVKIPRHFFFCKNVCLNCALAIVQKEAGNFSEAIATKRKALLYLEKFSRFQKSRNTFVNKGKNLSQPPD